MSVSPYKVLFLSSWYPTRDNPTMGNFVEKHAEAVALCAKVTVLHVCFSKDLNVSREIVTEEKNNITSHIVYLKKGRIKIPVIREIIKLWRIIRAYQQAYKQIFKDEGPDIVHANILIPVGLIAYLFFKTKKIPYIITEHWTGYLPGDPNKPGRSMIFFRHFANKARFLTPVTDNLGKAIQSFGIKNNFRVVPNVVDTEVFKEKVNKTKRRKHILHVSSLLDVQKNFSGILLALGKLKTKGIDFIVEVISDGDFEQYKKTIDSMNLSENIIFHGKKNTKEVADIMQQCDLLLLFSNYENFPCVIPEAWSCGLPVLSTNVGGISEYMNEENGILIEPNDMDALGGKLEIMLTAMDTFDSHKIRNFAVDHFSYKVIGSQFIDIYHQALK
jgi:glycosyltransferase involved in cell wall biosynthesis